MKILRVLSTATILCLALAVLAGGAQANVISGKLWHVPEATSQNAIPANVPVVAADVTFDVNSELLT